MGGARLYVLAVIEHASRRIRILGAGCIKTPGFMIPAGSSAASAPPIAAVDSCGTSRRYQRWWSRPAA